jgi:Ca-activated chloride channel family protein
LRDEIVDLGTRYGIVTPYTSYLALEDGAADQLTLVRPQNDPRGGGAGRGARRDLGANARSGNLGVGPVVAPPASATAEAAKSVSGEVAVRESRRARAQQEATRADDSSEVVYLDKDSSRQTRRKVGSKTFYLRGGVWVDADFKEDARLPETALAFGSEEYFALVKREPQLARFFALGERVVVVFNGRVYRVGEAKP